MSFWPSFPDHARGGGFRAVVRALWSAPKGQRVVWGIGASVSEGLGPIVIDLMERGFVSAVATNGAAIIHDSRSRWSVHIRDVDEALGPGSFGMDEETRSLLNQAKSTRGRRGLGLAGRRSIPASRQRNCAHQCVAAAARSSPGTAHGLSHHIIQDPRSGRALGEGSLRDFRRRFERAGWSWRLPNCGSAGRPAKVLRPSAGAQSGRGFAGLTTANLDSSVITAQTRRCRTPDASSGRGYSLLGHNEIMIPLRAAIIDADR